MTRRRGGTFARVAGRTVIALASVTALAATALGWVTLGEFNERVTSSPVFARSDDEGAEENPLPPPPDEDDSVDILLVGNDSRTDAHGNPLPSSVLRTLRTESTSGLNTDTLILVRVPKDGGAPSAVSIPRDTYTRMSGGRDEKINAVYGLTKAKRERELRAQGVSDVHAKSAQAGQRALVRTVQALTGVRVDHYAEVNLLGFYEVTEAVGGVEVCLNQATTDKDSGAEFTAGYQTISGGDALAFVRQRQGLPRGDLDRIVRQQVFMAAVANKVLSTGTLSDMGKLDRLMTAAGKSVVLDEDWSVEEFAQRMQGLTQGGMRFVTLPVSGTARDDRGQSIVTVDQQRVRKFVADLVSAPADPPTPTVQPTHWTPRGSWHLDGGMRRSPLNDAPEINSERVPCVN